MAPKILFKNKNFKLLLYKNGLSWVQITATVGNFVGQLGIQLWHGDISNLFAFVRLLRTKYLDFYASLSVIRLLEYCEEYFISIVVGNTAVIVETSIMNNTTIGQGVTEVLKVIYH